MYLRFQIGDSVIYNECVWTIYGLYVDEYGELTYYLRCGVHCAIAKEDELNKWETYTSTSIGLQ